MTQAITVNQNKGSRGSGILVVRSDASGFLSTSDNAPTDAKANTAGETISAMYVAEIAWSCASAATWSIKRGNGVGANTLWTTNGTSGFLDFQASQMRLETTGAETANVSFTLAGGTGNIIIKMHKQSGE
jgi:hypothetical protein